MDLAVVRVCGKIYPGTIAAYAEEAQVEDYRGQAVDFSAVISSVFNRSGPVIDIR